MSIHARRRVVGAFVAAGATAPDCAIDFASHDPAVRRMFARLRRHGAVRECDGRYWLDPQRLDTFRRLLRWRVLTLGTTGGALATALGATVAMVALSE